MAKKPVFRGKMPEMAKSMKKGGEELKKLSSKSTSKSRKGW